MYSETEQEIKEMQHEGMTIESLSDNQMIVVDYSDDDIIIIDSIRQFAEPSATRLKMNMIVAVKEGKGQGYLNGEPIKLYANQLLLCPPNTVLSDFMFSPDFEFKAIFLSNKIIQSFLREKITIWNEMMYIHKLHVVTMNPRDIEFISCFYDTLQIVIDSPSDYHPYRVEVIQSLLRSGILGLAGRLSKIAPIGIKTAQNQASSLFKRFLDLISSNRSKCRTVEDYASALCVSPKYLTVVCKKSSGRTANEWIREHILEDIRYYLKQTDMPMKQIADQLGFANPSFFGRYVKEHFGMTPLQFRQS